MIEIFNEDCLEVMKRMDDNSIDAIVTDPPYGISFMNKKWDYNIPSVTIWQEALRILKPGGHMLVACGTRTQHRMACNIEDAGFEIRDTIVWCYSTGFPKSLDVSKALDKELGAERCKIRHNVPSTWNTVCFSGTKNERPWFSEAKEKGYREVDNNIPSSPIAHTYNGYGTSLKPAIEMFTLARKPISEKNIALNVMKWGTGGINVDGCRVGTETLTYTKNKESAQTWKELDGRQHKTVSNDPPVTAIGRFPANLIHDGSDEVVALFPETKSGAKKQGTPYNHTNCNTMSNAIGTVKRDYPADKGSAARFFYCPKASKSERNQGLDNFPEFDMPYGSGGGGMPNGNNNPKKTKQQNNHPTVKPLKLMQYLIKLIAPPTAIILDPFMGSGTTGVATILEGYSFIGCEIDPHYHNIAQQRINHATQQPTLI